MLLDSKILPVSAPEQNVKQIRNKKAVGLSHRFLVLLKDQGTNLEDHKRCKISNQSLVCSSEQSFFHRTKFSLGSSKSSYTRHIQNGESKEAECTQWREHLGQHRAQLCVTGSSGQDGEGADNRLFCSKSSDKSGGCTPIIKSNWCKSRSNDRANRSENAVCTVSDHVQSPVETLQEPDNDGGNKDDGKRFVQEVFSFFPHMEQNAFSIRQTISRKLHDEWNGISLEDGVL